VKTFNYGVGSSCNSSAIPLTELCVQSGPGAGIKFRCVPDYCKPDYKLPKPVCDTHLAQCAQWGVQMKWSVIYLVCNSFWLD
jgi:hypothetical protein